MPPVRRTEETNASRLRRELAQVCAAVADARVSALNEKNPERDWKRFSGAFVEKLAAIGGPDFVAALEFVNDIPAPPAAANVLTDALIELTVPQMRQRAIRAMVSNSLGDSNDEGSPRRLVAGAQNAGGMIAGNPQAWMLLTARYEIDEPEVTPAEKLADLLKEEWPSKLDSAEYQAMVSRKVRLAQEINLAPPGANDAEKAQLQMWWSVVATPPHDSIWYSVAEKARVRHGSFDYTTADRNEFVSIVQEEVRLLSQARARSARKKNTLATEGMVHDGFGCVGACCAFQCGGCDDEAGVMAAGSAPSAPRGGSAMRGMQGAKPSSAPNRTPGGSWQRHPCVRCRSTTHPRGHKCDVKVECGACGADHLIEFCWIAKGIQLYNRRLPPQVAEQYDTWHKQYLAGTYVKVPGGPPRVRIANSSKGAASVEYDTDEDSWVACINVVAASDRGGFGQTEAAFAAEASRCDVASAAVGLASTSAHRAMLPGAFVGSAPAVVPQQQSGEQMLVQQQQQALQRQGDELARREQLFQQQQQQQQQQQFQQQQQLDQRQLHQQQLQQRLQQQLQEQQQQQRPTTTHDSPRPTTHDPRPTTHDPRRADSGQKKEL